MSTERPNVLASSSTTSWKFIIVIDGRSDANQLGNNDSDTFTSIFGREGED